MLVDSTQSIGERLHDLARRISVLNPEYRAYSHVVPLDHKLILTLDEERTAGRPRSPIHGLTVSVKGNIPVAGLPWTEGCAIFAKRVATRDAAIVKQVRKAGGIVVGTTTLSELAMYGIENPFEPMGLNPWDVCRTAGGSSTGAGVACALDLADVNIGTDSGGSIRNPACHCGVVGFMPRIGALSSEGKANHTPSLSTVGLITRSVSVLIRAFAALGGGEHEAAPSRKLIVPTRLIEMVCDEPTRMLFHSAQQALSASGFTLIDREVEGWLEAEHAAGVISLFECGQALAVMDLSHASSGIRDRAAQANELAAGSVASARKVAQRFKDVLREALDAAQADAVLTPTWPFAAHLLRAEKTNVNGIEVPINPHRNCFVRAANAADACAITLPSGLYPREQVPAGIQLMASGGSDHRLLAVASLAESILPPLPQLPALSMAKLEIERAQTLSPRRN